MSLEKWLSDNNDKKKRDNKFSTSSAKITLSELEQYLFEAANILRGPVEHADFKTYIFPMLFFKRISDVYEEEFQQALRESNGDIEYASFAENHRFQIHDECHWKDVREKTFNVGEVLVKAMRGIEKANPDTLFGIFGDAQWTNKERFSDSLLIKLIEHFSRYNLSNSNVEPDIAGRAYEYLIKKFADMAKKKAGEFYTPRSVIRLITMILGPREGESIYDPACGTGGMLLEAVNHLGRNNHEWRTLKLFGQEKNLTTSAIARMNLILHGIEDFKIIREDTLRNPAFFKEQILAKFDCVIANPPFSLKNWGREIWENDRFGRNLYGVPPKDNGDYAWIEHMLCSLSKPNGRMAIVLPHGVLFRGGQEATIRKRIIESDLLDSIIGLAPNLFYGTGVPACILIFKSNKSNKRKRKFFFIDGSRFFKKQKAQNYLLREHVDQLFEIYSSYKDIENKSKIVFLEEIIDNHYNLNLSLYIDPIVEEINENIVEVLELFRNCYEESLLIEKQLIKLIEENK